jgi:hypothetical protein
MAAAVSTPLMASDEAPQRLVTVAEGLLEVLARVLLAAPAALPSLLQADADVHARFFDTWLSMASARWGSSFKIRPVPSSYKCHLICSTHNPAQ